MNPDNRKKPEKKGFPGGFFFLILIAMVVLLTFQSASSDKSGRVSFSHQLEHLVNLDLIHPEESKKTSLNDNLVTFSGRFKEQESEEGQDKIRYLGLLQKNHQLSKEKDTLFESLEKGEEGAKQSALFFLRITGFSVPSTGYSVVGAMYNTADRSNEIVLKKAPDDFISLSSIEKEYKQLSSSSSTEELSSFEGELVNLVRLFQSPTLGIGNEEIKKEIKELEGRLSSGKNLSSSSEKLSLYGTVLASLSDVAKRLDRSEEGVRLLGLRSVRSYVENIDQYETISEELKTNSALLAKARQKVTNVIWFFNNQELSTTALEKQDPETYLHWYSSAIAEWNNFSKNKGLAFKAPDQPRNTVLEKRFKSQEPSPNYLGYLFTFLPVLILLFLLYFVFSRQMKGVGSGAMNFGKSPAKLLTKEANKVTFKDVAGAEEAKEELKEIVDFLKDPSKFTALGARIPKGVLLVGSPGTGKTLVAKAVAGEANRPFFSISGSDFVEMFVGVGASRIRDMFDQAKKNAPCIIFMDEIDAVGRHRGAGIGGGHDEREQTLNQLLVEMDGFDTREGVILMAATNRPDILDKALLRPGRFDRRVVLDLPDVKGRFEILKVHARKIKIDGKVELMDIARNTPGASGADLENIMNEAALLAARRGKTSVTQSEVKEACDKVRFGKERRSLEMDEEERKRTAYHEAGHAIVGLIVENSDPVDKVTIIPRGMSLGATHFMPKKNRLGYWKKEALDFLAVLMGGRAAEEVFVKDTSSGAQQDIMQATHLARSMVCEWGMSDILGLVSYDERSESGQYLGMKSYQEKVYSEETAKKIDQEIYTLLEAAHKQAIKIVEENGEKVELMVSMLMEFETLDAEDVKAIMNGSWDTEKKRERLQEEKRLYGKTPPPPPKMEKEGPTLEPGVS